MSVVRGPTGIPFTARSVERYAGREPTQAAGAALLRLAWRHRDGPLSSTHPE